MIILGIDPGTTAAGYALVKFEAGRPELKQAGMLKVGSKDPAERLCELADSLETLIGREKPEAAAVETLFFSRNAKTAMEVAEARGVILLTAARAGLKVYQYTPLEVKKHVTGDGGADKKQVKKMVELTLGGQTSSGERDDVYDAIAVALTHAFHSRLFPKKVDRY